MLSGVELIRRKFEQHAKESVYGSNRADNLLTIREAPNGGQSEVQSANSGKYHLGNILQNMCVAFPHKLATVAYHNKRYHHNWVHGHNKHTELFYQLSFLFTAFLGWAVIFFKMNVVEATTTRLLVFKFIKESTVFAIIRLHIT